MRTSVIGTAMAGYDGHRGWLYTVAVSPGHRRRGVGTALVRHAVAALRTAGCIKVNLQIRSSNLAVRGFYESLGFAAEERLSMGHAHPLKPPVSRTGGLSSSPSETGTFAGLVPRPAESGGP